MSEQTQEPQKNASGQKSAITTSNPGATATTTKPAKQKGESVGSTGKLTVFHS